MRNIRLASGNNVIFAASLLALLAVPFSAGFTSAMELSVTTKATEFPELTRAFRSMNQGWIGADGAYSIPVDDSTTMWTFGDTWIGSVIGNKRSRDCKMLNNTAAIQKLGGKSLAPLQFKWLQNGTNPGSLWTPNEAGCYFWPGDGIALDSKAFSFLHKITTDKSKPEPFQFRTVSDYVVRVDNPLDQPKDWKMTYADLGNDAEKVEHGTATIFDDKYVYIYCSNRLRQEGLNVHPTIIARVPISDFKNLIFKNIEFFKGANARDRSKSLDQDKVWVPELHEASVLFPDAAPEMSVTRVKGIPGFVAIYMPPLSKEIFIRHAPAPEGPWSERIKIYDCPEKDDGILLYSAKAHPELAREKGELVVTYCRNSKDNQMHYNDASIYFPQAIKLTVTSHGVTD